MEQQKSRKGFLDLCGGVCFKGLAFLGTVPLYPFVSSSKSLILNQKMAYLRENLHEHPLVTITYFEEDGRKTGGAYKTIEGQLQNIDDYNMSLVLKTGETVFLKSIFDIQY